MRLGISTNWRVWAIASVVVLLTGLVFSGVTKLEWTNWDDDEYVYENIMVMQGDYGAIFSEPVNNNYNPLPVAMHAWEWKQVLDKPLPEKAKLFHFNNLWMHLVCTALVFWLMTLLGLKPVWAAVAALLFGIHPLRVESVAWITERKDVMFGMFYVGALIAYVRYLDTKKLWMIGVCGVLFLLSLLSKIQAVSLPLSMLAIDWYRERKFDWKLALEKVPFFIGSAIIGYVGVMYLQQGETIDTDQTFGFAQRFALGLTSYCVYIAKALVPYETCTFYPYPKAVGGLYYIGMVGAMAVVAGAYFLRKISRETTFGLAFFSVNIVFLLQIVGAGSAYMADRFAYVAYIGLFFSMALVMQRIAGRSKSLLPVVGAVAVVMLCASAYLTSQYVPAWENSDTLWSDVIRKYPRKVVLAYVNRGQYLRRQGQNDRAYADFNTAIELQPKYPLSYLNRGNIYFDRNDNDKAIADYTKVLELVGPIDFSKRIEPVAANALSNRGAIYSRIGMRKEALADFDLALKINPNDKNTWSNRGITYFDLGDYPKAIADFTTSFKLDAKNPGGINMRGVSYMRLGRWTEALADFNSAIALDPKMGVFYGNRAIAHANLGNKAAGLADAKKAQSLGQAVDPNLLQSLQQ